MGDRMPIFTDQDRHWMELALDEARAAMQAGELPIGCVLVGGTNLLNRGQTQTSRRGSMAAHGEICALLDTGPAIYKAESPLTLYSTLEPCLMCLGACSNCSIKRVVFAMPASLDGGASQVGMLQSNGQLVGLTVQGGLMAREAIGLMGMFVNTTTQHFGGYDRMLWIAG